MDAPQHVVVAFDGSPLSELALHRALRLTRSAPFALIHAVCVVDDQGGDQVRLPTGEMMSRWSALETTRLKVSELARKWQVPLRDVGLVAHLRGGDVAQVILDFAYRYHADQIVLGAHSDRDPARPRVGRSARRTLEDSSIPVHIETALTGTTPARKASPMRWAYVFGRGTPLRRGGALSAAGDRLFM